jgi:hypothetical protein
MIPGAGLSVVVAAVFFCGQAKLELGPNVHVSKARASFIHFEVVVAADPTDPKRLLAGAITNGAEGSGMEIVAFRSFDGGATWEPSLRQGMSTVPEGVGETLSRLFGGESGSSKRSVTLADPTIAYGPDGSAYYAYLYVSRSPVRSARIEVVRSSDGGRTWNRATTIEGGDPDRPFLAVDRTSGKFHGRIYCNCSSPEATGRKQGIGLSTSSDAGRSFSPLLISVDKDGHCMTPGQSAVLSDGTLVVPYVFSKAAGKKVTNEIRIRRSIDGGESLLDGHPVTMVNFHMPLNWYFAMPGLAVDHDSQEFKDRLYLVWSHKAVADQRVYFTLSRDKGATWSKPVVLSEQSDAKGYDAALPAVAVNRKGVVAVSWYDSRESQDGEPSCHVRLRASLDGGASWLPSVRITDVPSRVDLSKPSRVVLKDQYSHLGDTAGLAADAGGVFHPVWVDKRTGVLQVFTATVAVENPSASKK